MSAVPERDDDFLSDGNVSWRQVRISKDVGTPRKQSRGSGLVYWRDFGPGKASTQLKRTPGRSGDRPQVAANQGVCHVQVS